MLWVIFAGLKIPCTLRSRLSKRQLEDEVDKAILQLLFEAGVRIAT
jgi:hypothetical protein